MPRSCQSSRAGRTSRSSSRAASPPQADAYPAKPGQLPECILESKDAWEDFLRENLVPGLDIKAKDMSALGDYLRTLGKRVNQLGGWLEVTGRTQWAHLAADLSRDAKADYEAYLFPIQKFFEFQHKYRSGNPFNVDLPALRPASIVPIKVFTPPVSGELTPEFWSEVFAEDVAILRGFVGKIWQFDHTPFSMDYLERHHGDFAFDVLIQDRAPDSETMKLRSGTKKKCSIAEYVAKMKSELESGPGTGPVPFGVNLDIGGWQRHIDELQEKLPKCVNFGTDEDSLSHIRLHVNGMTLPQIYLKVMGCWTGAHQENLAFTAININHGPGACQWWSLCPKANSALRDDIRKRLKFDMLKSETLWWPDENFLMSQGYKTYYGVQEADDMVYVGPATLHWVKSAAATINSAWNFGGKTVRQFEVAFLRDAINRDMGFESLVQVHTLALDLLNHEMAALPADFVQYLASKVQDKFSEELTALRDSKLPSAGVFPGHLVRRCETCKGEILYAYAACNVCSYALCIPCVAKHTHPIAVCSEMFTEAAFARLLQRAEARVAGSTRDLFDMALNTHFNAGEKQKTAEAWTSPFHGAPSYIQFTPDAVMRPTTPPDDPPARPTKRNRGKDSDGKADAKKKRKSTVVESLTQETYSKPYTRSMAKTDAPDEPEEVEEEHKPTREPEQVLGTNSSSVVESAEKQLDSDKSKDTLSGPKAIETREIHGTEVSIGPPTVETKADEGVYRIPKKVKVPKD